MDKCGDCNKPINRVFPRVICTKCGHSACGRCASSYKASRICPSCKKVGLQKVG